MKINEHYIVSTDLDGTLLDHHTYSWKAASPAIDFLMENKIPIIFNTSKTLAEAIQLQQDIGIDQPVIIENGSALAIPLSQSHLFNDIDQSYTTKENHLLVNFGQDRKDIVDFIQEQKQTLGKVLESYSDWSVETIMKKTGLDRATAALSNAKLFSEPFIWLSDKETYQHFQNNALSAGFKILQGGRFYHLLGDTNKAKPLHWLLEHYKFPAKLICLGDNKNDIHMLNAADFPVCVKSPTSPYPEIETNAKAIYTDEFGPIGWNSSIFKIFNRSTR